MSGWRNVVGVACVVVAIGAVTRTGNLHASSPVVPDFGTGGLVLGPVSSSSLSAVAVMPDGSVLFGASDDSGPTVRRYSSTGVLDPAFAPAAEVPGVLRAGLRAGVHVDSMGRIVAAGTSTSAPLVRFLPNGQADASFTPLVTFPTRLAMLPSDGLLSLEASVDFSRVVRLLPTGQLDTSFNPSGSTPGSIDLPGVLGNDLVVQPDGSVVIVGQQANHGIALRLSASGALDPTFDVNGALAATETVWAVAADANGGLLMTTGDLGTSAQQSLRRVLSDGRADEAFGGAGSVVLPGGVGLDVTRDSDGRIIVAGYAIGDGAALYRFLPDGSPDRSFTTGGVPAGRMVLDDSTPRSALTQVIALPEGTYLGAGYTSSDPSDLYTYRSFMAKVSNSSPGTTGAGFNPVAPARVLDTRAGLGAPAGKVPAQGVVRLQVAGVAGVPPTGASAVTMNVTVVGPDAAGYATVYPCDIAQPVVSNLNFAAGQDVPNLVTVPIAADGTVCISVSQPAHLLADIAGWYGWSGSGFNAITPNRVLDTRNGFGGTTLDPGETLEVRISGTANVPMDGVSAAALNVTATRPQGDGFVTVFPCGISAPVVSNLNFVSGRDVANLVTVPVGQKGGAFDPGYGSVCMTTSAPVDVLADVAGWFGVAGAGFNPVAPARVLDTRAGLGAPAGKVPAQGVVRLQVAGVAGVPPTGASAVTMNVTVVGPDAAGYATVYPCDIAQPVVSNLNFAAGQDVPNLVTVPIAADGTVCISVSQPAHLLADIAGWYSQT